MRLVENTVEVTMRAGDREEFTVETQRCHSLCQFYDVTRRCCLPAGHSPGHRSWGDGTTSYWSHDG